MTQKKFFEGLRLIQDLQLACNPTRVKSFKVSLFNYEDNPTLPYVVVAVLRQGPDEEYSFFRFYSENSEEQWEHTFKLLRAYV